MLILEMLDNRHYLNTEIIRNKNPHRAKSRQDPDILTRLAEDNFLSDLQDYLQTHYKNKSWSYPVLTSLLCERSQRKTVKEILSMSCFRFDATAKPTEKFISQFKKVINEMQTTILDKVNKESIDQYTEMKIMIKQIQSAIPKDRANLEHFISTELLRVTACIEKNSSQTEIADLRDTLLTELSSQHSNIEDIVSQLEEGFQSINESLDDVHMKLDKVTQSMLDFYEDFRTQLNSLKSKEVDRDDIEDIVKVLGVSQSRIDKLQAKDKITNTEVLKVISKSILTIQTSSQSLNLSQEESLTRLQNELQLTCKDSAEDQNQLKVTLSYLSQVVRTINQKLENRLQNW